MTLRKNKYILIGFSILSLVSLSLFLFHFLQNKNPTYSNYKECDHVRFANAPIAPSNKLNDKNDIHLLHAMKNGLKKPFETDSAFYSQIDEFVRMALLVKVADNQFYKLKSLKHSQPYLIPEAIDMLNEIGYKFQERLKEKKYKNFRFLITSLLRTEEAQNQLSHRNSNASIHSSHLYGTTVDISYKDFYNTQTDSIESSYEAVITLTSVLREMREDCKFLVVRERKQSCFHLTVVVCRPIDSTMND